MDELTFRKTFGFTLVELLIVILIVGTLAGVALAVINPVQQQNKARDAGIIASLEKVFLAAQAHTTVRGSAPTEVEFLSMVDLVVPYDGIECRVASLSFDQTCRFSVEGIALPDTCNSGGWSGSTNSSNPCYFYYFRNSGWIPERYRVFVRPWGLFGRTLVMDSTVSDMYHCEGGILGTNPGLAIASSGSCQKMDN